MQFISKIFMIAAILFSVSSTAFADSPRFMALCKDSYHSCMYFCPGQEGAACKTIRGSCTPPVVKNGHFLSDVMLTMDFEGRSDMTCKVINWTKSKYTCGDFGWGWECRER